MNQTLDRYTIERMIVNNAIMTLLVDKIAFNDKVKDISDELELAATTVNEDWDTIVDVIYDKYPEVRGRILVMDYIDDMLNYFNDPGCSFTNEELGEIAEMIANNVLNFVEGYNRILVEARVRKEDRE